MTEQESLIKCGELMDGVRRGHELCRRIQDGDTDIHGMLPNVITLPNDVKDTSAA